MTFINMQITGITMDNNTLFPLIILKDEKSNIVFPLTLQESDRNTILSAMVEKNNLYSGILKQLIWQQNIKIQKVTLEETDESELVSVVYLQNNNISDKIFLYPAEGILFAAEFGLEIAVRENLIGKHKYFKRTMNDDEIINKVDNLFLDSSFNPTFAGDMRKKKQTLQ